MTDCQKSVMRIQGDAVSWKNNGMNDFEINAYGDSCFWDVVYVISVVLV